MQYVILFLLFLSSHSTLATDSIIYQNQDIIFPGALSQVYIDYDDTATINYVSSTAIFKQHRQNIFQHQNPAAAYWIKFRVYNPTKDALILTKDLAQTTGIDLFRQISADSFEHLFIGNKIPFYQRKYKHTAYLFDLNLKYKEGATFYAKIKGDEMMNIYLQIANKESTYRYLITKELLLGLFTGIMLIVFFYNLFIWGTTGDLSFLLYVVYVLNISITIFSIYDYTLKYLWPNNLFLANSDTILFGAFSIFFLLQFVLRFLDIKARQPKFYKTIFYLSPCSFIPIFLVLNGQIPLAYQSINILNLITGIVVLVLGLSSLFSGYKPARFFALGWFSMVGFSAVFAMTNWGFIENSFITFNSIAIGVIFQSFFMSFALADKINFYKQKSYDAIHQNKLILMEQNQLLEEQVQKRTSELKENYIKIKNQNEDKETLLKEVHHRVKNNLQVITSLLSLQKTNLQNEKLKEIFTVSQNRINSMAIIHEMLYQSNDFSGIDFKDYLPKIAAEIIKTHQRQSQEVSLDIQVPSIYFNLDMSIALGLIINEIITNSIQHGFKNQPLGTIRVLLEEKTEQSYILDIKDNGCGFSQDSIKQKKESLGLNIIQKLAKQLDANVVRNNPEKGVHYQLKFEKPSKKSSFNTSLHNNKRRATRLSKNEYR